MRSVCAFVVVATVMVLAAPASAVPTVVCGKGKVFDESRGTCRKVVPKCAKVSDALDHVKAFEKDGDVKEAELGVKLLDKLCTKQSCVEACSQLGVVYMNARANVTRNVQTALDAYVKACDLKDDEGCIQAFEIHHQGQLGAGYMDSSKGLPYLEKACTKLKSGRACHRMAQLYEWGGTNINYNVTKATELYETAFPLLEKDCQDQDGQACATVGLYYQDRKSDLKTAMARFKRGCDNDSALACYQLAYLQDPEAYFYVGGRDAIMDASCILPSSYNTQCGNYYDDDGDRKVDFGQDPGCSSATDNDENDSVPPPPPLADTCWATPYALYEKACTNYDHSDSCIKAGGWLADQKVKGDTSKVEAMAMRVCKLSAYSCTLAAKLKDAGVLVPYDSAGARDLYAKACEAGNGEACVTAAERFLWNYDYATGLKLFEKACDLYQPNACTRAGYEYQNGYQIPQDLPRAYILFQTACNRGDVEGCISTGNMLLQGKDDNSLKPKPQQAAVYFEQACNYYGNTSACSTLAGLYEAGTVNGKPEMQLALQYYEASCFAWESWDTSSCMKVVRHRSEGAMKDALSAARAQIVVCRNYGSLDDCKKADKMLREANADSYTRDELRSRLDAACNMAYPIESACLALALFYRDGSFAISRDPAMARSILQTSCDRYSAVACYQLAETLEKAGETQPAQDYFRRACDGWYRDGCVEEARLRGNPRDALDVYTRLCYDEQIPRACSSAATAYYSAAGVTWDVSEAYRLFDRACELEDPVGCDRMGVMWEHGIGQAADPARAYESYRRACAGGHTPACGRSGRMLELGVGVTADAAAAEEGYVKACEAESADACHWLAAYYEAGGKQSASKIAQLNQRAFDLAKAKSTTDPYQLWLLGTFHRDGVATLKSAEKAAEIFTQACDAYLPLGCLDAGRMYMGLPGSEGLTPDMPRASVQLDKACAANVVEACTLATQAKGGGPKPGVVQPGARGCGCQSGGEPGTFGLAALLLAFGLRRRRAR